MNHQNRFLEKSPSYYEYAQQQSYTPNLFDQATLQADFNIRVLWGNYTHYGVQHKKPPRTKLHEHSFFELYCILSGALICHGIDNKIFEIPAGNFILTAPQTQHFFEQLTEEVEVFVMTFELISKNNEQGQQLLSPFASLTHEIASLNSGTCSIIEQIMQEYNDNKSFGIQKSKLFLQILTFDLLRTILEKKNFFQMEFSSCDTRLVALKKHISDNSNCFFTVSELAKYLKISPRHLNNIIRNELGISAKDFIDKQKSKQAKKLLLETKLSIQQIGDQLGFSDPYNFSRFFKRVEGISPILFRTTNIDYNKSKE